MSAVEPIGQVAEAQPAAVTELAAPNAELVRRADAPRSEVAFMT